MSKPNTKKMLTVMITIAMVFSALAVLSLATEPAFASSSGTITISPTVFTDHAGSSTLVIVNGGTFGSGATVNFYQSASSSFPRGTSVGTYTLPAGTTTLSNAVVTFSTLASNTTYIAASDDKATFTNAVAVTVTSANPTLSLSPTSVTPGTSVTVSGSGWDSGSTLTLYLKYVGGTTLISSFPASALGSETFSVPTNLPGGNPAVSYNVVAEETSSSSTNYGITADASFTLSPSVTLSVVSINGATSSSFTVTGHGFPASDSFTASTSLNNANTIQIGSTDVLNPAFTSDSTGTFTVSVTGLTAAIVSFGSQSITMHDSTPTTFSSVGSVLISVPNPDNLGFTYAVTPTTGSTYNVNDTAVATVWDFPASQSVTFWLGSTEAGSLTTDANGAGKLTSVVPAVPAATYTPVAYNTAGSFTTKATSGTLTYAISAFFQVVDPTGTALTTSEAEYLPSTGLLTVQAFGLTPSTTSYDFYDSQVATSGSGSGVGATGLVTSVAVGTESASSGLFTPAANGTLIFTYSPGYASLNSPPSTGTVVDVTSANSVAGYDTNSYAYDAIGSVTISTPSSYGIMLSGGTGQTLSFSNEIPVSANLYPGVVNEYNAYLGSTELTVKFTNSNSVVTTGTKFDSGDSSFSFTVPSVSGVYDLNITYNGESVATESVGSQAVVVSSTGSAASSGTLQVIDLSTANTFEIVGYGYDLTPTLYQTSSGNLVASIGSQGLTDGAFAYHYTPSAEPAGTYAVFTIVSSSGTNYYVNASYTMTTSLSLSSTSGSIASSVTATTVGLVPTTYYGLYFGGSLQSTHTGTSLDSGVAFTVPTVAAGTYTVSVQQVGSTSSVASHTYKVKANSAITLGTSSQYAFPGQLVTFSVTGLSQSYLLDNSISGPTEYFATVSFNGTPVATVPATFQTGSGGTTYLNGSFENPNNAAGSNYKITFGGYLQASSLTTSGGSVSGGSIEQVALTGTASDFFGLVSGNGALLTGISSSQIATLEADINSSVSTSLTVPIAQLNAAITSINGAVATLKTTVGNITTKLDTINATVASIESGQVLVQSDLGSITTSLTSLNSSIMAFNGNVATINTTLGQVVTSLGSIQTQVTANANGIATIKTDVGTIQGQIVSQNGNVSTIKTSLGTLTTNVSNVSKQTQGFPTLEIFLIVIIVLVLITLVISFLAVSAANKAARRATEEKKL